MIGHRLNRALDVLRPELTSDGAGGWTETLAPAGAIRVQASQPSAAEREAAQQSGVELAYVLHTLIGNDVRRRDVLTGELPTALSPDHRLRVVAVVSDSQDTYLRLECEAVQVEGST